MTNTALPGQNSGFIRLTHDQLYIAEFMEPDDEDVRFLNVPELDHGIELFQVPITNMHQRMQTAKDFGKLSKYFYELVSDDLRLSPIESEMDGLQQTFDNNPLFVEAGLNTKLQSVMAEAREVQWAEYQQLAQKMSEMLLQGRVYTVVVAPEAPKNMFAAKISSFTALRKSALMGIEPVVKGKSQVGLLPAGLSMFQGLYTPFAESEIATGALMAP